MREWLLRMLGELRPAVIKFDALVVESASPGSLIILRTRQRLVGKERAYAQEFLVSVRDKYPDLRFLMLDADLDAVVAPSAQAATTSQAEPQ